MQYDYREHPVYLTGSIAWYYQDILKDVAREFELRLGTIVQSPVRRSDSLSLCFINNKLSNSVFIYEKNLYSYCVCFWGCWVICALVLAQPTQKLVNVVVSPDRIDWKCKAKEEVKFTVQVFKNENLLKDVVVDYELGPEYFPTVVKKTFVWRMEKQR